MKPSLEELLSLLTNEYEQFTFDAVEAKCERHHVLIWLGDFPLWELTVKQPVRYRPNLLERWRLWRAVRAAQERKLALALSRIKVGGRG